MLDLTRQEFEAVGNIRPKAFLLTKKHPETKEDLPSTEMLGVLCGGDYSNPDMRIAFAKELRRLAAELGSVGMVFMSEAWMVTAETEEATKKFKKHHSLEHVPGRKETVLFQAEHRYMGQKTWTAEIVETNGIKVLSEFVEMADGIVTSRFLRVIPEYTLS